MRPHLIEARKKKGLTQAALGEKIGRSMQTICDLEHGRNNGSVEVWDALQHVLKVPQKKLRYQPEKDGDEK